MAALTRSLASCTAASGNPTMVIVTTQYTTLIPLLYPNLCEGEIMDDSFFCNTCLTDRSTDVLSPDPRYCQGCYDFLLKEAELLPQSKRPKWIPKSLTLEAE